MPSEEKTSKSHALNDSLQTIVKGTIFVLIALLISYVFGVIGGVLIARNWTEQELGIYSLTLSIFHISSIFSILGLNNGIVRSIAHSRGKKEYYKIADFVSTSVVYNVLASIIISIVLYFSAGFIANQIFNEPSLILPLRIFSFALPFYTVNSMIVAYFRGYDNVMPMIYFKYLLDACLLSIFIIAIVVLGYPFIYIFYAYAFTGVIVFIGLILYGVKKHVPWSKFSIKSIFSPAAKELMIFSLPLFATAIISLIMNWTGLLLLGTLRTTGDVGFYHVAAPFATFVGFPLGALIVTFVPIFSGLYGKGKLKEMRNNYKTVTKWIAVATFPVFILFFLFTELTITVIVGPNYLPSTNVLRVLCIAYIFSNFMGPCEGVLIAMGKSRFMMLSTLVAAILNIALCLILIPQYSYLGVAFGTGISIIVFNIIKTLKIYMDGKIKPLGWNLIKPTILSILIIFPIYYYSNKFLPHTWWSLIILVLILYGIFIFSVLFTRSIDKDDLKLLLAIERKTGWKIKFIKKIIRRFQ